MGLIMYLLIENSEMLDGGWSIFIPTECDPRKEQQRIGGIVSNREQNYFWILWSNLTAYTAKRFVDLPFKMETVFPDVCYLDLGPIGNQSRVPNQEVWFLVLGSLVESISGWGQEPTHDQISGLFFLHIFLMFSLRSSLGFSDTSDP